MEAREIFELILKADDALKYATEDKLAARSKQARDLLERDDVTLLPTSYYEKLPPVEGRHVLLLDPMLATGGSAARACSSIGAKGPAQILFVCVVAAPQGLARMEKEHPEVPVFTAALDRDLTDNGYILPGLGDFGDRLYGTEPHLGAPPNR